MCEIRGVKRNRLNSIVLTQTFLYNCTMKFGYTTGSCATAAAKASAIGLFTGNIPDEVEIDTPSGARLRLKIHHKELSAHAAMCAVQKDAGDDPDVTNGCFVHARVEKNNTPEIEIDGGEGVGRVTKPGLQVGVGYAAINPTPRRMIEGAAREVAGNDRGLKIIISVPEGKTLGEKTFNPKLGILGGISIIGTTGIVRPMSEDAFKTSLLCGLDIARGIGYETVVLVPGSLGERAMLNQFDIPKDQVIQISNFVGFMLNAAVQRGFKRLILAGHPGKLAKLLRGDFHTHSSVSRPANDMLIEIIEQQAGNRSETAEERGKKADTKIQNSILDRLTEVSTVEGIVELLRDAGYLALMNDVAEKIGDKVTAFCRGERPFVPTVVGVILFDMKGVITGISDSARTWLDGIKTKSSS